jgi:phosphonate transport system ATP-binding protein
VILADEPIASLDPESSRRVMELLSAMNREHACTVLVSLHQVEFAIRYCPRTIALRAGRVVYDGASSQLTPELLADLYGTEAAELFGAAAPAVRDSPAQAAPIAALRAA